MGDPNQYSAKDLFERGMNLSQICVILHPMFYGKEGEQYYKVNGSSKLTKERARVANEILKQLGFESKKEYEDTLEQVRQSDPALKESQEWNNQEKSQQILNLFESGITLGEIRTKVFFEWFSDKSQHEISYNRLVANYIVLRVLECQDWDDYHKKRNKIKARLKYQRKKQEGTLVDRNANKAAMERDGYKCVVTGSDEKLVVHHIDGDRTHRKLSNLVTLSEEVHLAIHNGARAYVGKDLEYWEKRVPDYISDLKKRLGYMKTYVEYLHKTGKTKATIECISGEVLFGSDLYKKLNISSRSKRRKGWYQVVVLEPTGFHEVPKEYEPPTPRWIQDCEDFDENDEEPLRISPDGKSCKNCILNGNEACPFDDPEYGPRDECSICSKHAAMDDFTES